MHDTSARANDLPLGPALEFLQRLWSLNRALERLSLRMEKRLGVTGQQRLMLRCLGAYPGVTAGQFASLLRLDPGTVSATLRRLEHKALISRRRDRQDNRRVALTLTQKGRALVAPTDGTVEAAVEELLSTSPAAQIRAALRALEGLSVLVDQQLSSGQELPSALRASRR